MTRKPRPPAEIIGLWQALARSVAMSALTRSRFKPSLSLGQRFSQSRELPSE